MRHAVIGSDGELCGWCSDAVWSDGVTLMVAWAVFHFHCLFFICVLNVSGCVVDSDVSLLYRHGDVFGASVVLGNRNSAVKRGGEHPVVGGGDVRCDGVA